MPRDANGVYALPPSYHVQIGDTVLPVQHNPPFEDVADALTNSIDRDGRTVMTGPLQMGGNKVTGLAPGSASRDSVTVEQVGASFSFKTVSDLLADTRLGYSSAEVVVDAGDIIAAHSSRYEVEESDATVFDEETAGGVKLILVSKPVDSVTQQLSERDKQQARENIGARADSGAYGRDNILSPVSQADGEPTGGIIERGENANGEYVRYADGTQICWSGSIGPMNVSQSNGSLYISSSTATWTFPADFISPPEVAPGRGGSSNGLRWVGTGDVTESDIALRSISPSSSSVTLDVGAVAIGRWF